jgi:uncharacterized protein (DUF2252 family)
VLRSVLIVLVTAGCSDAVSSGDAARAALIVDTLVYADQDLIALRPDLVAQKYLQMSTTPQTFLRGTSHLFYRDLTRNEGDGTLIHGDGAELVWLYGDPHLENVGSTFDDDGVLFDDVDFDAVVEGPFDWDVRRAALALAVGCDMAGRDDAIPDAAGAIADGWRASVEAAAMGQPQGVMRPGALGRVLEDLLADGVDKQGKRQDLTKYTTFDDLGQRHLLRADDMVEIPSPFDTHLDQALLDYAPTRRGGALPDGWLVKKDAIRKLGSGISSLPNLRFWILVEGPAGPDDDRILELKEERDPPEPAGELGRGPVETPFDNASRVYDGTSALLSSAGAEPELGHVIVEGVAFQVRSVSRGREDVTVTDLASAVVAGTYDTDDLNALGESIGRMVGAGHARTASPPALLAASGDAQSWHARTAADAGADLPQLLHDYALYQAQLKKRGPLLGAQP